MPGLDPLSDAQLLARCASGDRQAFAELYRRNRGRIYGYAVRVSGDPGLAEEIVQETFLAVIERPEGFDPERGQPAGYLLGIARRRLARRWGRDRLAVGVEPAEDCEPLWSVLRESPFEALDRTERLDRLRRGLDALPFASREVIALCELDELSYAEAAEVIGVPVGTVRSRLHRARGLLLRKLVAEERACVAVSSNRRRRGQEAGD